MYYLYYDRQGNPLTFEEYLVYRPHHEKRVAETTLPSGRWVSTVWLGLNHQFSEGPPLIFETMVFPSKYNLQERDCDRYSTEAEALAGHERMCREWSVLYRWSPLIAGVCVTVLCWVRDRCIRHTPTDQDTDDQIIP